MARVGKQRDTYTGTSRIEQWSQFEVTHARCNGQVSGAQWATLGAYVAVLCWGIPCLPVQVISGHRAKTCR